MGLERQDREKLIEIYGEPLVIPNSHFEIGKPSTSGICEGNEVSVAIMENDRKFWGNYLLMVVNGEMIRWQLHTLIGHEGARIMTRRLIFDGEGNYLIPGMIYTEPMMAHSNWQSLMNEAGRIDRVTESMQRGDLRILDLPMNKELFFEFYPLRMLGGIRANHVIFDYLGIDTVVGLDTLDSLIEKVNQVMRQK